MNNIKKTIIDSIERITEENGLELAKDFNDDSVLLESGLDSLGFAILFADLEDTLGYDPFVMMEEPVYPRTLKDFVSIYEKFSKDSD